MGIRTILLAGDAKSIAETVGRELGIDEAEAELLPDQKLERIKALISAREKVRKIELKYSHYFHVGSEREK